MIQYNGSMNLGILQNRIQQGLQSKSQTAKKMATALNSNLQAKIAHKAQLEQDLDALTNDDGLVSIHAVPAGDHRYTYDAMTDDGKPVTFSSGINWSQYYFNYKAPSEKFQNKNIEQSFMKPGYYRGEEMQNPYLNMYYEDRNLGLFNIEPKGLRMVSNEDNSKSMVSKTFGDRYMGFLNSQIPLPALKTENGETKTTFIPLDNSHLYHEIPLEPLFDSQVDVENNSSVMQNMIRFVNNVDDNSPAKEKELKKQFNMIDFFQDNKYEVFDEPVKLAKKAYQELETTGKDQGISDLNDDGSRIEFLKIKNPEDLDQNKNGYTILITSYDEENRKSMLGMFTLLRDNNGNPLKENKEGKIFKPGEEGYDNEDNKLCFDIKLEKYYSDIQKLDCQFERNINLYDAKHRQNIKMSRYDRNGAFVREEEASSPKYSENWLKRRICKVWHNTYKTDLKEAKANFEHDMLNPNDLDPSLKNGD